MLQHCTFSFHPPPTFRWFKKKKKFQETWESETSVQDPLSHCKDDSGEVTTTEVSSVKWAELHKIVITFVNTF